jgi:hypothetical protein
LLADVRAACKASAQALPPTGSTENIENTSFTFFGVWLLLVFDWVDCSAASVGGKAQALKIQQTKHDGKVLFYKPQ